MLNYVIGDATNPQFKVGTRIIAHVCNDQGGWGSGFVMALSDKWPQPEKKYREWYSWMCGGAHALPLGHIQMVRVPIEKGEAPIYIANMVAQHKFASKENPVAIRYEALIKCLYSLNEWANHLIAVKKEITKSVEDPIVTFHMPRIGCGLAGGDWDIVSSIISPILDEGEVFVYDLPNGSLDVGMENLIKAIEDNS